MNNNEIKIPKRILGTLLNSLSSGVVPRFGLEYIAIGRKSEIGALVGDLEFIRDGGSTFRFVIGRYGSGKSFLMQLLRSHCLERGFITADADLSPERRLAGTKGQGIATFRELIGNLASKSSPEGGALMQIIARWLMGLQSSLISEKELEPGTPEFLNAMRVQIMSITSSLEDLVCGFDFAGVINKYYTATQTDDEHLKSAALKWLRGEYTTKMEARQELGVNSIIDDSNWYDFIKLYAVFVRRIGFKGLVIIIDECVNLYKIPNRISRENNYEKILSMFNDTMQGKAEGLGIIMGGTPQFLEDARRGLFSYEALKSRLAESRFSGEEYKNYMGPIIRLERLTDEEIFALVSRCAKLHAQFYGHDIVVTDAELLSFLKLCLSRAGADVLVTPREIIRDFLSVMSIMYQNPGASFMGILGEKQSEKALSTVSKKGSEDDLGIDFDDIEI
ncbi:MAG: ATP-binding protein [Eubacteriales bacterium]